MHGMDVMSKRTRLWLYLGVAVLAAVLWAAGVSTTTLVTIALVGMMLVMHVGGHGGHPHGGGSPSTSRDKDPARSDDVGPRPGGHQH